MQFAVRKQPGTGLDGAFRIYLHPDHLDQAGLKFGELCEIANEDGEVIGCGLAWRSQEGMGTAPKTKSAKMTSTLRDTFGIKEGSQVNLSRTDSKLVHAEKVSLMDVTPKDWNRDSEAKLEDGRWRIRCMYALSQCEGFANNTTFEINAKEKLRKSFTVNQVTSTEAQPGVPNLYYFDDATELILGDGESPIRKSGSSSADPLSPRYIGGLSSQLQALNRRLRLAVLEMKESTMTPSKGTGLKANNGILIHGFEGTGKSLIMEQLEHCKLSVTCLQKSNLNGGTVAKNQDIIKRIFSHSRAHQPSIILMDNASELIPPEGGQYTNTIANEFEKLAGSQVIAVAACHSTSDIHTSLVGPGRFSILIELPIPDQMAREEILDVMLEEKLEPNLAKTLSSRTHGFTGKDIAWLLEIAQCRALDRCLEQREKCSMSQDGVGSKGFPKLPNGDSEDTTPHGHIHSQELTIEDFEYALTQVRPTALREIFFESPKVRWDDIGGSKDIQQRFDKIIGWPLYHADIMASLRKKPKKGVLLYGPPGCSKTLTAQAIATNYGLNFIAVKGAELISMYVGESERAVREIFRKARAAAPCVIFFDEIDSIASERESTGTKGLNVLTTLLNEMDGFDALRNVFVLAATNKPEILDPAIMRPGRFDSHIYLGLPDAAARQEILNISTKGVKLEENLDLSELATATKGYTGAEIVQICALATDETTVRMMESAAPLTEMVNLEDFESAIAQTKRGITKEMVDSYLEFSRVR